MEFREIISRLLGSPVLNDETTIKIHTTYECSGIGSLKSGNWFSDEILLESGAEVHRISLDRERNLLSFELFHPTLTKSGVVEGN